MRVLIDGIPTAEVDSSISIFDWVVIRGLGVFEVIRSYGGGLFRLDAHLDRLQQSASALTLRCPDRDQLRQWAGQVADEIDDGYVRIILTAGGRDPAVAAQPRVIVIGEHLLDLPKELALLPTVAPWHPATSESGFPGVKWVSYAANVTTSDRARRAGHFDALLISSEGVVLEGPTFTIAWIVGGRIETPSLDLGILGSITREVVLSCADTLGIEVIQGHFGLDRLATADEAFALSTVLEVRPVTRIDDLELPAGSVTAALARCYADVVRDETRAPAAGIS